ncbi:MAG: Ig-like domain-containing protein [Kofleriaceae bacterium]|nr:Ig-like domain-containing protein [Kofleriaceae bacterium]
MNALSADDSVVEGLTYSWNSSDDSIVSIDENGTALAVSVGEVEIQVSANGLTSNSVTLAVVENVNLVAPSVRITPENVGLEVGQTMDVEVAVRNEFAERVNVENGEVAISWTAEPAGIVSVDGDGVVTAIAPGTAKVFASYLNNKSPATQVRVVSDTSYPAVNWVSPSSETTQSAMISVVAKTHTLAVGTYDNGGLPVVASDARALLDGIEIGALTIGAGDDFGLVLGNFSIESAAIGEHLLTIEATINGETVTSVPRILTREVANQAWETLEGSFVDASDVAIAVNGEELMILASTCRRECNVNTFIWQEEASVWEKLSYQQRSWDQTRTGVDPNYTYVYDEEMRSTGVVAPPRFVGWGWPPTVSRDLEAPSGIARIVAYSYKEARTSFNVEDGPPRYWNDCYASEWDPTGGFDGSGGWKLLSGENPEYLYDLPNPGVLDRHGNGTWEFPMGVEVDRTHDCVSPELAYDSDNRLVMGYMSTPVPDTDWGVELSQWSGSAWQPQGSRLDVSLASATLSELLLDQSNRAVVSVSNGDTSQVHRMGQDGSWTVLEDGALGIEDLSLGEAGGVFGAGRDQGDLHVFAGADDRWAAMGSLVDTQPWAPVHEVSLLRQGEDLIVAWTEGPLVGNRNLYVAKWLASEARWQAVGDGAIDTLSDETVTDIDLAVDSQGRLIIAYLEPDLEDNSTLVHVRRTTDVVVTP